MKLIIQIPCFNEEKTLPLVLDSLPKIISGISEIEIVVINDGSIDKTAEVARQYGATVINHAKNLGLGMSFKRGVEYALKQKVDILVNLDGDNQYPARYIPALIQPILDKKADVVVGNRTPWKVKYFSVVKRFFQYIGNFLTRKLIRTNITDTVSGFRAYSQKALYELNITAKFSYVLDTLMQLSVKDFRIISILIQTNPPTRKSRLYKNIFQYMFRSGLNILRVYCKNKSMIKNRKNQNRAGNYFNKYGSNNSLIKYVVNKYLNTLNYFLEQIKVEKVLDLGCGEGAIIKFLKNKYKNIYIKGYDIDNALIKNLKQKFPGHDFKIGYLEKDLAESQEYDLVLCLEVLEHIQEYKQALENIKRIKTSYLIFSVPNEPFFRFANLARLKYLKRLGNTPGHLNNFTYFQFKKLIKQTFLNHEINFKNCLIWNFAFVKINS